MASIGDIPVQVEGAPAAPAEYGNALPVLSEVRHALAQLVDGGEPTQIDLGAMPFGPGDEDRLMALLGSGEVTASVNALGLTRIQETAYRGVWIVEYLNTDDQRVALHLEIATVPQLLRSPPADLSDALAALETQLAAAEAK
ncbi:MAG: hydrogenase expression/formation C-terminal domain-containing protein [Thiohalocapsa sp.]|jgi:hydrogenase-1 operon protein HyaF|uniref:hydrogenase expression/formation C-terminal domain-containing protein n=1 Tax=Thiohalocapsa sp. TaxID=2497641 RepID=UPI0025DA71FE|nr:hydrogenase expression/formation C-terminal domain-containing protein [Thiohalocapsa sp.]